MKRRGTLVEPASIIGTKGKKAGTGEAGEVFVVPENSSWAILNEEGSSLLQNLAESPKPLSVVEESYGTDVTDNLLALHNSGLITIDGVSSGRGPISPYSFKQLFVHLFLTENCNLACKYCYVSAGDYFDKMSHETAVNAINLLRTSPHEKITIQFHGGEPLLQKDLLINLVRQFSDDQRISFGIQTNGTLIDDDLAAFIAEKNIGIGISLDGPQEINDATRIGWGGKSWFEKVMNGIRCLQRNGIGFGVITVVNSSNIDHIEEIIDFLTSMDIHQASFTPIFYYGRTTNDLMITPMDYLDAQTRVYEKTRQLLINGIKFIPRELRIVARNVYGRYRCHCTLGLACPAGQDIFAVDANGNLYPCAELVHMPEFVYGNVNKLKDMDLVLKDAMGRRFRDFSVEKLDWCKKCVWRGFCQAGCAARTLHQNGFMDGKPYMCDFYIRVYPFLMNRLSIDSAMRNHLLGLEQATGPDTVSTGLAG